MDIKQKIAKEICAKCKSELEDLVMGLKLRDKLRPIKTANRFLNALCPPCKLKAIRIVQRGRFKRNSNGVEK